MEPTSKGSKVPAPLLRIAVAVVPIVIVCSLLSGLHDQRAEASAMTPEAIRARLQPLARIDVAEPPKTATQAGDKAGAAIKK